MSDSLFFAHIIGAVIAAIFAAILGLITLDRYHCEAIGKQMNKPIQYRFITGCLVEYEPGKFVPLSNYRVVE